MYLNDELTTNHELLVEHQNKNIRGDYLIAVD